MLVDIAHEKSLEVHPHSITLQILKHVKKKYSSYLYKEYLFKIVIVKANNVKIINKIRYYTVHDNVW